MRHLFQTLLLLPLFASMLACTTTGRFRIPPGTQLQVTDRMAPLDANGEWTGSPFFWSKTDGAEFRLIDSASGRIVRTGKLKTHFRVASIFWPPAALIYWPMGLRKETYDLTRPSDGILVRDDPATRHLVEQPAMAPAPAPAAPAAPAAQPAPARRGAMPKHPGRAPARPVQQAPQGQPQ